MGQRRGSPENSDDGHDWGDRGRAWQTTENRYAGGTTTSFSDTPQAQDDILDYTEESVVKGYLCTSIILDVMQNDLGGNAKTLFSIDDGSSTSTTTKQPAPIDLASADYLTSGISKWEDIGGGIRIRINNGKVEMDLDGYLQTHGLSSLQALGAGVQISDSFTYAIKLANGTLSWATATFNIVGTNDEAVNHGLEQRRRRGHRGRLRPTAARSHDPNTDGQLKVTTAHGVGRPRLAGGYLGAFTDRDRPRPARGPHARTRTCDTVISADGQAVTGTYTDGHRRTMAPQPSSRHDQPSPAPTTAGHHHGGRRQRGHRGRGRRSGQRHGRRRSRRARHADLHATSIPATTRHRGNAAGTYGAFTINATTGAWTYTLEQRRCRHRCAGRRRQRHRHASPDGHRRFRRHRHPDGHRHHHRHQRLAGDHHGGRRQRGHRSVEAGNLDDGTVVAGDPDASGTLTSSRCRYRRHRDLERQRHRHLRRVCDRPGDRRVDLHARQRRCRHRCAGRRRQRHRHASPRRSPTTSAPPPPRRSPSPSPAPTTRRWPWPTPMPATRTPPSPAGSPPTTAMSMTVTR